MVKVTSPRRQRRTGRFGFAATLVSGVIFVLIGVALAIGAVSAHSAAARSGYTVRRRRRRLGA